MRPDAAPPRLWTANFVLVMVAQFAQSAIFYLLMSSMALYAVERFGASDLGAGLAAGSYIIGATVARLFAGKCLDLLGRRRQFLLAIAGALVLSLLYFLATTLPALIAVRLAQGFCFGVGSTTLAASVQALIPDARRGEGNGYFGMAATLATALGPWLAVRLTRDAGVEALFWASAAFAAVGLVAGLFMRLPGPTPSAEERAARWRFRLADLLHPQSLPAMSVALLLGLVFSTVLSFVQPFTVGEGMGQHAGTFFLVYAAFTLAGRFVIGRLQDVFGDNAVLPALLLVFGAGMASLGLWREPAGLFLGAALVGLGFGGALPCLQAIAVKLSTPRTVGVATSTYYLMLDLGTGVGPILLGALAPAIGLGGLYVLGAALMPVAVALYWWTYGRRPEARRPSPGTSPANS